MRCLTLIAAGIAGIALLTAGSTDAKAKGPKPPKQACTIWTNGSNASDGLEMNLLIRPVPGKLIVSDLSARKQIVNFYEIHGIVSAGSIPFGFYPLLHGTAWRYPKDSSIYLAVTVATDAGPLIFRGGLSLESGVGDIDRIDSAGNLTDGTLISRACSEVILD